MFRPRFLGLGLILTFALTATALGDGPAPAKEGPVSFLKQVAPIFVENCIGCHNARKSESKFVMTRFDQLIKGGQRGAGIMIEPGDPDASFLVELIRPGGEPRMPYKQDPLPADQVALIERWVKEGGKYDGATPTEDWTAVVHRNALVVVPDTYPVSVPITALAYSPDNLKVASSGYHEINLWKGADGTLERRLRGLAERVYDIAYSSDGHWLASASGDPGQSGTVTLWIAEPGGGGKPVRDLLESTDCVFAVAFSPDGKQLAAAGADRAIHLWDTASGKELAVIEDHADWIFDLAFSPDGKRLASASRDKTSKVFDLVKKEAVATFPGHLETVYTVAFAPDGKTVVSGGGDARVRFWNPDDDGKQVREVGGFGGPVFKLQFAPDGKSLIACGSDKTVRVFNPADGSQVRALAGHNDWVYTCAFSRDGLTVASGSWDGEVRFWNLADGKPGQTILAAPGLKLGGNTRAAAR